MVLGLLMAAPKSSDVLPVLPEGDFVKWSATEQDLGLIPQGVPAEVSFEVTNMSDEPMLFTSVRGSCGCTATEYSEEPIAPGATTTVKATYNAQKMGAFKKTVTVYTNLEKKPVVLTLKGEVVTP